MGKMAVNKASRHDVRAPSRKLLKLLKDKDSQLYKDNVARFGIPEELVWKTFSEEELLESVDSGKSTFYLALENGLKVLGFAHSVVQQDEQIVELNRIVVFPECARKGIGTRLLNKVVGDQEKRGISRIVVNAGKEKMLVRMFYRKNGFKVVEEKMLEGSSDKIPLVVYELQMKPE
jgi:ribosomal protein S18 acetylase RimI-like enzyme